MIDKNENKNVNVPYKLHVMHDIDHCLYFYIYTIRQKNLVNWNAMRFGQISFMHYQPTGSNPF